MKARLFFTLSLLLIPVPALAQSDAPSVEHKVAMEEFISFQAAQTYDRVCNGSKLTKLDETSPAKENMTGHTKLFEQRMTGLMRVANPKLTDKDNQQWLGNLKKKLDSESEKVLHREGCQSAHGVAAGKTLKIYTDTTPANLSHNMDQRIINQGGKITVKIEPPPSLRDNRPVGKSSGIPDNFGTAFPIPVTD